MANNQRLIVASMLAVAAVGCVPGLAAAQANSTSSVEINTLGLPAPGGGSLKKIINPYFGAGEQPSGATTRTLWDPTAANVYATRALRDPVVSKGNIGFYNSSDQTLTFQIEIANEKRSLTLGQREVVTLPVANSASVKGTIGSGAVDTTTLLTPGAIYTIRAEASRWVFAKF